VLPQRLTADRRLDLGNKLPTLPERERGIKPLLDGAQAQFLEPTRGLDRESLARQVFEWTSAPQRKRALQLGARHRDLAASHRFAGACAQALEACEIELL
jgi:hypothetical protein